MSERPIEDSSLNKKSIDVILSMLNILKIVTNIKEFEKWLREYHKRSLDRKLLEGYRFFVTTVFRCLIGQIELDSSLGLEEDYTFFRARFKGVPIQDVPNTCEKTIFIKNLWKISKSLRKAKSWKDVKSNVSNLKELFELFEKLYNISYLSLELDKKEALQIITKHYTYIFLNDTSRNIPNGYLSVSTIPTSESEEHYMKVFEGYAITLEFLWFKLLGKKVFENSCTKNLHKAFEIFREKEKTEMLKYKDWIALDCFFPKIENEIIKPIENKLKKDLIFEPLFLVNKVLKKIFQKFLRKYRIKEPFYIRKRDEKEIKKWLDYKLLWYDVEVLASTGAIFSGVPAFISILIGAVNLSKEKVYVKIFKHPEKGVNGYTYSYGILIPTFGSSGLADYSGWLIFFDCATDFSGFGGSLYVQANTIIREFKDRLDVEEIEVDKTIFKNYLKERSVSSIFDRIVKNTPFGPSQLIDITSIKEETKRFTEDTKGILFELIVYKWLNENNFEIVEHQKIVKNEEIDIFGVKNGKGYLFECKVSLHENRIEKLPERIIEKRKLLEQEEGASVVPVLVTYTPVSSGIKNSFEEKGIKVEDNFKNKIKNIFKSKPTRNIIIKIMESNFY